MACWHFLNCCCIKVLAASNEMWCSPENAATCLGGYHFSHQRVWRGAVVWLFLLLGKAVEGICFLSSGLALRGLVMSLLWYHDGCSGARPSYMDMTVSSGEDFSKSVPAACPTLQSSRWSSCYADIGTGRENETSRTNIDSSWFALWSEKGGPCLHTCPCIHLGRIRALTAKAVRATKLSRWVGNQKHLPRS